MKHPPIDLTRKAQTNFRAASFQAVCDMETPLTTIGDLLRMIGMACLVEDAFSDGRDASAIQRTVWLAVEQLKTAERLRGDLFHLTHPNPDGIVTSSEDE